MAQKFICYYPIFGLPPTKYHFNTARILSERDHISGVIVLLPDAKTPYIDQDQAFRLFSIYDQAASMVGGIRLEKSKKSNLLLDLKERFEKDTDEKGYIALDEKVARSHEFNEAFGEMPNMQIELIPSNFLVSSKDMISAIETGNKSSFFKLLPEELNASDKDECWKVVHAEIEEKVMTKQFWESVLKEDKNEEIFNTRTTGMPNYDSMIQNPGYYYFFKSRLIELKYMSPEDYLTKCAEFVHDTTLENEISNINTSDVELIMHKVEQGVKLDTPVLNVADKTQEGRHRSVVAQKRGIHSIPVYVVTFPDEEKQSAARKIVENCKTYDEALSKMNEMGVPLDEKTFKKIKWKEFKRETA